jgi:DNA-binding transcriptional regulator YiaG
MEVAVGRKKKPKPEKLTMEPEEFRRWRESMGYAHRSDLAAALGVSKHAIEHWEYGRRKIPATVIKLLDCLAAQSHRDHS